MISGAQENTKLLENPEAVAPAESTRIHGIIRAVLEKAKKLRSIDIAISESKLIEALESEVLETRQLASAKLSASIAKIEQGHIVSALCLAVELGLPNKGAIQALKLTDKLLDVALTQRRVQFTVTKPTQIDRKTTAEFASNSFKFGTQCAILSILRPSDLSAARQSEDFYKRASDQLALFFGESQSWPAGLSGSPKNLEDLIAAAEQFNELTKKILVSLKS